MEHELHFVTLMFHEMDSWNIDISINMNHVNTKMGQISFSHEQNNNNNRN